MQVHRSGHPLWGVYAASADGVRESQNGQSQKRLRPHRHPAEAPVPGTIPSLRWGSSRTAPHWCEGGRQLAWRLRARVGLRLGAGLLEITWGRALLHRSSNQLLSWTTPLVLSAIFAVSSTLHWELVVKLQLPMSAVRVEAPYMTFAWCPPSLARIGLSGLALT